MKLSNLYRIGTPILIIMLTLSVMVGCAYDAVANQNTEEINTIEPEELIQVEQEWDAVIENENSRIAKINVILYVVQPPYSSTITPSQNITVDDSQEISVILGVLDNQKVTWEHMSFEESAIKSNYGKKAIQLELFDAQGQRCMHIIVYDDNSGGIYYELEPLSETAFSWKKYYYAKFEENVFASLKVRLENIE